MSKYFLVALICFLLVAIVHAVPDGRIVDGLDALPDQFPYQISLKFNSEHFCGGSIISKDYILTAAHCVVDKDNHYEKLPTSAMTVQAGTNHRIKGGVIIPVAETIVHPKYIDEDHGADIALVRLAENFIFSRAIEPIELSANDDILENTPVIVSGWGRLWEDGAKPNHLQWTVLQSLSEEDCSKGTGQSPEKILCLSHSGYKGICTGDSGGPAVVYPGLPLERLVGVASFGVGVCGFHHPDGFVKVSYYLDWIKENSDVEDISE